MEKTKCWIHNRRQAKSIASVRESLALFGFNTSHLSDQEMADRTADFGAAAYKAVLSLLSSMFQKKE